MAEQSSSIRRFASLMADQSLTRLKCPSPPSGATANPSMLTICWISSFPMRMTSRSDCTELLNDVEFGAGGEHAVDLHLEFMPAWIVHPRGHLPEGMGFAEPARLPGFQLRDGQLEDLRGQCAVGLEIVD